METVMNLLRRRFLHLAAGAAALSLQYDLQKDFEPSALITTQPYVIVAKKTIPANDLLGLVAWLKSNPGKALQGTTGIGTPSHVAGVFFQKETGTKFEFVPY